MWQKEMAAKKRRVQRESTKDSVTRLMSRRGIEPARGGAAPFEGLLSRPGPPYEKEGLLVSTKRDRSEKNLALGVVERYTMLSSLDSGCSQYCPLKASASSGIFANACQHIEI